MRIVFSLTQFPALSQTFVLSQITGLLDLGVDVQIISHRRPKPGPVHRDVETYRLLERTHYARTKHRAFLASLLRKPTNLGWGLVGLRVLRFGSKATDGKLRRACRTWKKGGPALKPDVVLCHFAPTGDLEISTRALGAHSAPVVTVVHGFDIARKIFDRQPIYPRIRASGDLILPISRRWSRALLDDGYAHEKVVLHHVGIRLDQAAPLRAPRAPDAPLRVLTVARFVEKKGIEYALRALARLKESTSISFRYTLVGEGPLLGPLKNLTQELGLCEQVTFTGPLNHEQVYARYASHDIFLLPSVTASDGDQEGIPTVLMEAMAQGLVAVATDHSGIPELIDRGVSGVLVPERDEQAICDALIDLDQRRARWDELRLAARAKVADEFNIDKLNQTLFETLSKLC